MNPCNISTSVWPTRTHTYKPRCVRRHDNPDVTVPCKGGPYCMGTLADCPEFQKNCISCELESYDDEIRKLRREENQWCLENELKSSASALVHAVKKDEIGRGLTPVSDYGHSGEDSTGGGPGPITGGAESPRAAEAHYPAYKSRAEGGYVSKHYASASSSDTQYKDKGKDGSKGKGKGKGKGQEKGKKKSYSA